MFEVLASVWLEACKLAYESRSVCLSMARAWSHALLREARLYPRMMKASRIVSEKRSKDSRLEQFLLTRRNSPYGKDWKTCEGWLERRWR